MNFKKKLSRGIPKRNPIGIPNGVFGGNPERVTEGVLEGAPGIIFPVIPKEISLGIPECENVLKFTQKIN